MKHQKKKNAFDFAAKVDQDIESLADDDYRLRKGRAKSLLEELLPISRLAISLKTPGISVDVVGYEDDGPVDGCIWISGYRKDQFNIEVTCTYSYEEHLRAELLNRDGYCPGAGPINREKGEIIAEMQAVDYDSYIHDTASDALKVFVDKNGKTYPEGTVLIIAFANLKLVGNANWQSLIESIQEKGGFVESKFTRIYLFNGDSCEMRRGL